MKEKLQQLTKLCRDVIECVEGMGEGDTGDTGDTAAIALRANMARIEAQLHLIDDQFNRASCKFDSAERSMEFKLKVLEERVNRLGQGRLTHE